MQMADISVEFTDSAFLKRTTSVRFLPAYIWEHGDEKILVTKDGE